MRLIDADELYEKTANWEAQALHMVEVTMYDEDKMEEWRKWSAVLTERSAFKHDIADAPTIDAVEVVHCRDCKYRYKMACHKAEFYECSHIGLTSENGKITHVGVDDDYFCADGAKMDGKEQNE